MKIQKKIKEEVVYTNGKKKVLLRTFDVGGFIKKIPVFADERNDYGTMTLALDRDKYIYYCREYRDGPDRFIFNFSAGKYEEKLSFEENAKKELFEELGVIKCDISSLGGGIVGSYDTGKMKYFIAKNCIFGENNLEAGEVLTIEKSTIHEFEKKIISGEIECPITIHCYTLAKLQECI